MMVRTVSQGKNRTKHTKKLHNFKIRQNNTKKIQRQHTSRTFGDRRMNIFTLRVSSFGTSEFDREQTIERRRPDKCCFVERPRYRQNNNKEGASPKRRDESKGKGTISKQVGVRGQRQTRRPRQ
jgi:hypothetical protein